MHQKDKDKIGKYIKHERIYNVKNQAINNE